ncbi:MAG: hypothetical protein LW817_08445, partial [Candidatus Caenarcaniphilales bacterium]|nr:hypothetical protein [Candidatus Caenarcaniphilales bacterium]
AQQQAPTTQAPETVSGLHQASTAQESPQALMERLIAMFKKGPENFLNVVSNASEGTVTSELVPENPKTNSNNPRVVFDRLSSHFTNQASQIISSLKSGAENSPEASQVLGFVSKLGLDASKTESIAVKYLARVLARNAVLARVNNDDFAKGEEKENQLFLLKQSLNALVSPTTVELQSITQNLYDRVTTGAPELVDRIKEFFGEAKTTFNKLFDETTTNADVFAKSQATQEHLFSANGLIGKALDLANTVIETVRNKFLSPEITAALCNAVAASSQGVMNTALSRSLQDMFNLSPDKTIDLGNQAA